jgi:hypothetical protein
VTHFSEDEATVSALRQRALSLALRYNFVTELTSLIVVQETPSDDFSTGNFTLGEDTGGVDSAEDESDIFLSGGAPATDSLSGQLPQLLNKLLMVGLTLFTLF